MKTTLIALAAGVMALSALPAAAGDLAGQTRPGAERQDGRGETRRDTDRRAEPAARNDDSRHGRWDTRWGARPPAPPAGFTRTSDWNRHVRACQQRYRSYNARTDRYVPRAGQTAVCRL